LAKLNEKLASSTQRLTKLKNVQGAWMRLESLRKDIASIKENVDKYKTDKQDAASKTELVSDIQGTI
jgi:multidrug resistance efflux pump